MILLIAILPCAIYVVVAYALLRLSRYFGGKQVVWICGGLIVCLLAYELIDAWKFCGAEPRFIAPSCDNASKCGDGQMIFNCDAPFGGADRLMIYIFGPLSIIIISILTYLVAKKPRRMQKEL